MNELEQRQALQQKLLAEMMQNPEVLASYPHAELYMLRQKATPEQQNIIAPYEHGAFAQEVVQENPLMAPAVAAGTLLYQPYKMLQGDSRSSASIDQIIKAYQGIGKGLVNWAQ